MSWLNLKSRMMSELRRWARGITETSGPEFNFDAESAIWWFANDYHSGGGSELYQILSMSKLRPGPSHRSVSDEGEIPAMMYEALEQKFIPKGKAKRNPSRVRANSNYAHQDAKLFQIVYIGRSKYRAIGRLPDGIMLWKGSGPTIYMLIENAQGEWGTGRFDNKLFAQPVAQQFSRLPTETKRYIITQQKRGSAITPGGIWKNSGGSVRKNIYTFNNPGNAQKILAENFMRGANSGVASSMYIHGNRIYSYGPHFPIAQRNDDGTILIRHPSKKAPSKTTAGHISAVVNAARQVYSPDSILYDTAGELSAEAKGPAAYSNPGVRKNIYTFNNPRDSSVESAARAVGLFVGVWSPGDGQTRYRFFSKTTRGSRYADYHEGDGIYTALGRKDALAFIAAYGKGRGARRNPKTSVYVIEGFTHRGRRGKSQRRAEFRTPSLTEARARAEQIFQETGVVVAITQRNPLTRSEAGYLLRHAKADVTEAAVARRHGLTYEQKYAVGHARGIGFAVQETGPKAARKAWVDLHTRLDRVTRNPCLNNPTCANPRHPHGPVENTAYGQRRSYADFVARKRAEYGDKFDDSDLAPQFIQYYESGARIEVEFVSSTTGKPYETKRGRVGVTTGWKPVFLLMLTTRSMGSPYTLGKNDRVVRFVRSNPLTVSEDREIEHVARRERIIGEQIQSPGSRGYALGHSDGMNHVRRKYGPIRRNPLLQTIGLMANPPVSDQWNRMTSRQRLHALEFVGYPTDFASSMARRLWMTLPGTARERLESARLDTSSRGTTRRRVAVPVGANPLTRTESGQILRDARFDARYGSTFQGGHTRSSRAGMAWAKAKVVRQYGPKSARRAASRIADKARTVARTAMSNPGVRFPKPGTKLTVAQAFELARRIGDRALIEQCRKALKLQKAANKDVKCVIWKTFPMGSKGQIDSVIALTHYGDSPETMYRPPPGSKKGNHMYRHNWGEKGGKQTVPLLASADGKMLLMPLEGKKVASDWLRH